MMNLQCPNCHSANNSFTEFIAYLGRTLEWNGTRYERGSVLSRCDTCRCPMPLPNGYFTDNETNNLSEDRF